LKQNFAAEVSSRNQQQKLGAEVAAVDVPLGSQV
jgi:hypothetical protein